MKHYTLFYFFPCVASSWLLRWNYYLSIPSRGGEDEENLTLPWLLHEFIYMTILWWYYDVITQIYQLIDHSLLCDIPWCIITDKAHLSYILWDFNLHSKRDQGYLVQSKSKLGHSTNHLEKIRLYWSRTRFIHGGCRPWPCCVLVTCSQWYGYSIT